MKATPLLIAALSAAVVFLAIEALISRQNMVDHSNRLDELNCVHRIYEDGSAVHVDAETANECLWIQLGQVP